MVISEILKLEAFTILLVFISRSNEYKIGPLISFVKSHTCNGDDRAGPTLS